MLQKRKSQQEYKEHNQYGPGLGDQGEQIYVDDDDIQEITRSFMPPPSSIGKGKGISSRGSLGQGKHTLAERESTRWYWRLFYAKNNSWSSAYSYKLQVCCKVRKQ